MGKMCLGELKNSKEIQRIESKLLKMETLKAVPTAKNKCWPHRN